MNFSINRQIAFPHILVIMSCAAAISYFIMQNINPLYVVGIIGLTLMIAVSMMRFESFIILLFVIKPFIDITMNARWFSVLGRQFNSLELVGVLVFFVLGYKYITCRDQGPIFNERIILIFLALLAFTTFINFALSERNIISVIDVILKIFAAYFMYFILHHLLKDEKKRLQLYKIVWFTTFFVSLLNLIAYFTGRFGVSVTGDVSRFDGLYNDSGSPAYVALFSFAFGTLYIESIKKNNERVSFVKKIVYGLTLLNLIFMLRVTITKSAILMTIVFLIIWWGIYKKKAIIVIPLILIIGVFSYTNIEDVQKRISPEIEFISSEKFSVENALSLGTGRVSRWKRLLEFYGREFTIFQQVFGYANNFGAHNQYIAYLMQVGLLGLTIFLFIIYKFYKRLFYLYQRHKKPELFMAITLLTVLCVYGLTGHPFEYTTQLWYLMILLSLVNVY